MSDDETEYTIRMYEPGDREEFLDLFETVFGGGSEEWFRWKYPGNPYVSHVPMFVAEHDGELVGARPYMAFRLRIGGETPLGLQTGDTMVHPDHQRRGLFTRMTQRSFDYYGDLDDRVLTFSVPNALSRPGYRKLGCHEVGPLPAHYRPANPGALAGGKIGLVGRAAAPVVRRLLDRRSARAPTPADVDVTRHDSVPERALVDLYERTIPREIHALRDERFYGWRFDRPDWEYRTYVAHQGEEPVAGAVVGRQQRGGADTVAIADVVPMVADDARDRGLRGILARVVEDHADADAIVASRSVIPAELLSEHGFFADDAPPLSATATPTVLISRVFDGTDDPPWTIAGRDLRSLEDWRLALAEQNTF
ncbi:GNAT family N-acetyltransferase [Halorubrum sp. JWXQ-INN 858]|uniref:GNAT family N-acetyltransferase n=1 Tax=Halorubrum sp. JWXQ-INN 858 TaxID=2690782 RepID=UPI001356BA3E|nr:GNAT family N-acetyltransferase [Halorubrum sp. JWXQ-INN 858]MWV65477.1 GNAT family N-acetyltransferase [Halorubrum sp. JWXQ-INN 858]